MISGCAHQGLGICGESQGRNQDPRVHGSVHGTTASHPRSLQPKITSKRNSRRSHLRRTSLRRHHQGKVKPVGEYQCDIRTAGEELRICVESQRRNQDHPPYLDGLGVKIRKQNPSKPTRKTKQRSYHSACLVKVVGGDGEAILQ